MKREIDRLAARTFDVLVVGGGIYGLTIAYDAAQRGLSVALIERNDFGSGASFNHFRTIHGGLRYLQTVDLARARESVRERRTMARIAPRAVRPLAFALPLRPSFTRGKTAMRLGFALDCIVAFDRNQDVPPHLRLPPSRVVSKTEAVRRIDHFPRSHVSGAAIWYDYAAVEADRLTFAFALAAAGLGATLANYVEAVAAVAEGRRVTGVSAVDGQSGRTLEIAARVTVNATGSAVDRLLDALDSPTRIPMLKAMNLVTRRPGGDIAIGGRAPSGRYLFMVPWRGRALFGTWEADRASDPGDTGVSAHEVAAFLGELMETFPGLDLTPDEVTLVHRGLVPAAMASNGHVSLDAHEQIRDSVDGLVSVAGPKYTTARAVAERVVDGLFTKLGRSPVTCRTASTPLPGDGVRDQEPIEKLCAARPELSAPVDRDSSVIGAELVWAARDEMAVTLADAVIRRTPLGALGYPGDSTIERAAELVGGELGWSEDLKREEIAKVKRFYRWQD